jgi:pyruvate/2-oxoglutarate/acetoin dehydrogenase E1 component
LNADCIINNTVTVVVAVAQVSRGLFEKFGAKRVIDTPITEAGLYNA